MFSIQCQYVLTYATAMTMKFNVKKLIDDCGGVSHLSKELGIGRTIPYRWIAQDMITSSRLSEIKKRFSLDVDIYFEGYNDGSDKPGS